MSKQTLVMKFGGTSVGSAAALVSARQIIRDAKQDWARVVVVTSGRAGAAGRPGGAPSGLGRRPGAAGGDDDGRYADAHPHDTAPPGVSRPGGSYGCGTWPPPRPWLWSWAPPRLRASP